MVRFRSNKYNTVRESSLQSPNTQTDLSVANALARPRKLYTVARMQRQLETQKAIPTQKSLGCYLRLLDAADDGVTGYRSEPSSYNSSLSAGKGFGNLGGATDVDGTDRP
jgi:hypothetical protein